MSALKERLSKFNLEVAEDKTRTLEFWRYAATNRENKGGGKPATFDFRGFTHFCSISEKGKFRVKRKTSRLKFNASLKRCKLWLRSNLTLPIKVLMPRLRVKLLGRYRYYGITDNYRSLSEFSYQVRRQLYWLCNRRSQDKRYNWSKYSLMLKQYQYPEPKVYVNVYDIRPELLGYLK